MLTAFDYFENYHKRYQSYSVFPKDRTRANGQKLHVIRFQFSVKKILMIGAIQNAK